MAGNYDSKHTGQAIDDGIDEITVAGSDNADRLTKVARLNIANEGVPEASKVVTTDSGNKVPGLGIVVVGAVEPSTKVIGMLWQDTS